MDQAFIGGKAKVNSKLRDTNGNLILDRKIAEKRSSVFRCLRNNIAVCSLSKVPIDYVSIALGLIPPI